MTKTASKGACIALGFQDIARIRGTYGDDNVAGIFGSCAHVTFLGHGDPETVKFASDYFKTQEIIERKLSLNYSETDGKEQRGFSTSSNRVTRPVVTEGEIKSINRPLKGYRATVEGFADCKSFAADRPYKMQITLRSPKGGQEAADFQLLPEGALEGGLRPWDSDDLDRLNLSDYPERVRPELNVKFFSIKWANRAVFYNLYKFYCVVRCLYVCHINQRNGQ